MDERCKVTWPDGGVDAGPLNPSARCVLEEEHGGLHSLGLQRPEGKPLGVYRATTCIKCRAAMFSDTAWNGNGQRFLLDAVCGDCREVNG